ncbi:MAG TPA: AAA family ATPase [Sphaerochaeta sp.]|jgi:putative ATPase|nr:AAA family ATPase [Sphaerochaeta sp.]HPY45398.1 AAA family ATPase [Sphaerochaeta sp.]HQB05810.1 AAA family ATPase [Sphaerochaeta sp.]
MELFSVTKSGSEPLAYRMRPRTLEEYVGQEAIIGEGRLLRRAIQADQLSSVIFYGPPGTGKTTLARVIANSTKRHFATLNAVLSGVKELRFEIDAARERLELYQRGTILFVDEVHRWNKSQQDALLPWVENGTVILIGATTENPFFEVNAALVSRSRIFQLKPLTGDDLMKIAHMTLSDKERGYGNYEITFEDGALEHLVDVSDGDARTLLNALELAVETTGEPDEPKYISLAAAEDSIQQKAVLYDKEGDYHFDVISAFIKSIRGSDPDAALYWLARMVHAGEEPRFIFRRMLISAAEDIGLADPNALVVVEAAAAAFERIGLPEGRFHLAQAALYLATAKKSNSTMGFFDALKKVTEEAQREVPNHLRDNSRDAKGFGHGEGYLYPHAYSGHWVAQQYLPAALQGKIFYNPGDQGYEATIASEVQGRREEQLESIQSDVFVEHLSYSPPSSVEAIWRERSAGERSTILRAIRKELFREHTVRRSDRVFIANAGSGFLLWEALRLTPEGLCVAQVSTKQHAEVINHYAKTLEMLERPLVHIGDPASVLRSLHERLLFEHIYGRNILSRLHAEKEILELFFEKLVKGGTLNIAQSIPSRSSRLSEFCDHPLLKEAEQVIYADETNPLINWDEKDLEEAAKSYGFQGKTEVLSFTENRVFTSDQLEGYLKNSYLPALKNEDPSFVVSVIKALEKKSLAYRQSIAILRLAKD